MQRKQVLVQLNEELLGRLDERASREGRSRSMLIREAIEAHLHDETEAEMDARIVAGYERVPQTDEEEQWALAGARSAIREEPW